MNVSIDLELCVVLILAVALLIAGSALNDTSLTALGWTFLNLLFWSLVAVIVTMSLLYIITIIWK